MFRSLPPRGAWIEMKKPDEAQEAERQSLPPRGAWIEIFQKLTH